MSFSPRSPQSARNPGNDWSSQSSVGSSSSGSWSRASALSNLKTDQVIHVERFRDIVEQYERGLSECIACIESDLSLNKSSNSWSSSQSSQAQQQYVLAINHKDALRQQLSKARQLRDEYETHLRLREALIKMIKIAKSRDCETELRENARTLVGVEKQLETMIGIFHFNVEAIEGWARICPRDQYELEFRLGTQRRVVRVRIGREGEREWDRQDFTFRATILDSIIVRVREVKPGWTKRYVTLGVTHVETRDLMRSRAQVMSLLANCSGSLKLRLRVKWTPAISSYYANEDNNSMPLIMDEPIECSDSSLSRSNSHESLLESLSSLMSALEDFQGQYEELAPMNVAVNRLWKVIARDSNNDFANDNDEEVESALAEFGFLDDNNDDQNNSVISRESSPVSRNSQWEACVLCHSRDAIAQLSHVGSWVLKAREKDALKRLADHAFALDQLGVNYGIDFDAIYGEDSRVKQLWTSITTSNGHKSRNVIVIDWRQFADSLNGLISNHETNEDIIASASEWLTAKISECDFVTILHVRTFFADFESRFSIEDAFKVALDTSLVIRAKDYTVFETLLSRFISRDWTPPEVTWSAARAMICGDCDMNTIAIQWLEIMIGDNEEEITMHLLSGLESHSTTTRRASAHALAHIRAFTTMDALLHVSTDDTDSRVRDDARKALLTFGGEAEDRWRQCSLTTMGFTGLSISADHKNRAKI